MRQSLDSSTSAPTPGRPLCAASRHQHHHRQEDDTSRGQAGHQEADHHGAEVRQTKEDVS